jgi:hypothetical protein
LFLGIKLVVAGKYSFDFWAIDQIGFEQLISGLVFWAINTLPIKPILLYWATMWL